MFAVSAWGSLVQLDVSTPASIWPRIAGGLLGVIGLWLCLAAPLLAAQHVLEMFRRALPNGTSRRRLHRLANRLTKILSEARKLATP